MPPGHRFVSEQIEPLGGSFDTGRMAMGEPGLPQHFRWRGREYEVASVLERWKTSGDCRSGSPERYVRKHWFCIRTTNGDEMRIYFDRQARSGTKADRWWLATIRVGQEET
jgi:phosphoribosylglycinamide formyltransferase-1